MNIENLTTTAIIDLISKFGFPVVAAIGMAFFVYYVWRRAINDVKPIIKGTSETLIDLTKRIRRLDNDLIRLNQKVDVVIQLRGRLLDKERELIENDINELIENMGDEA